MPTVQVFKLPKMQSDLQLKCNFALKFQIYQSQMCVIFKMYFMTVLPDKITKVVVQIKANMTLIFLIILFAASFYQSVCLYLHLFHFLWADARLAEEVPESRQGLHLSWGADDLHPSPAQLPPSTPPGDQDCEGAAGATGTAATAVSCTRTVATADFRTVTPC